MPIEISEFWPSIQNKRKANWKLAPLSFYVGFGFGGFYFFVRKHKFKIDAKQFLLPARRVYWLQPHSLN